MANKRITNRAKMQPRKTMRKVPKQQSEVVLFFMEMLTTIKLYHWKTRSYAQHKATDELHERIQGNVDKFVEVMLGKTSKSNSRIKMI